MKINKQIINIIRRSVTESFFCLLSIFAFLSSFSVTAQDFPVKVALQVTNPAPIYLSNYSDASLINGPIRTQLVLNDFSITNRQIALKISVKGQGIALESRPGFTGTIPLFIDGGTPLNVTTAEIAQYFELQNIVGISPQAYANTLPEGNYEFCMEVIDVITGLRLSQKTCTNAFVIQNDPPLLVLPLKGEEKDASKIQNIIFQWTSRGINITDVDYELSIVEVWNNQIDPQTAFLSSPPIFTTVTNRTSFRYGPDQPLLLSNKRYAWRVQAKAQKGGEPIALFENAGYSEIFWFDNITPCEAPKNISAEVKGIYKANIYWDENLDEITPYLIRYRQANVKDAQWFTARTTEPWATLWDLKEGTTYEYQVSSQCPLGDSVFSEVKSFTTDITENEETYYNCGITSDIELTNKEPIAEIHTNEVFTAGDFPVRITELNGSNGRYTGKGVVTIPYLKNVGLNVKFSNILINNEKQLADGLVITTYDPSLKNLLDVDEAIDSVGNFVGDFLDTAEDIGDALNGGDKKEVGVNFEIKEVKLNEDKTKIIITGKNGETKEVDYDEEDEYQIAGTNKTFRIDKQGNAEQTGQVAEGGSASPSNTTGVASGPTASGNGSSVSQVATEAIEITFRDDEATIYAFDKAEGTFEKETYPKTKNEAGTEVYAFHKAVPNGETDVFYADVKIRNKKIKLDSLIIKTLSGRKIDYVVEAKNTLKITVKGFDGYRKEEAIVTYKIEGGKQQVAANFFIHHLAKPAPITVNLVPMGGAVITASFKQELQAIYKKIGVEFNLTVMPSYNPDTSVWDKDENTQLTYDGSGVFKNFPSEFKAINKDYQTTDEYTSKAYYLFVTDLYTSEPLVGFMPKGSQFGYVFVNGSGTEGKGAPVKTAAHELGHGIFGLEHPFTDVKNPNTNTDWLMDYGTDTQFSQVNWARLGSEKLRLYLFQKDEDNELGGMYWLTPAWKPFTVLNTKSISANIEGNKHIQGSVPGFKIKDKNDKSIFYSAKFDDSGKFIGYYSKSKKKFYDLNTSFLKENDSISVYNYNGTCGKNSYYKTKWKHVKDRKGKTPVVAESLRSSIKLIKCNKKEESSTNCNSFVALNNEKKEDRNELRKYQEKLNHSLAYAIEKIGGNVDSEVRDKGIFNHIQFINTNDVDVFEKIKNFEILEDKLHLLAHYTKTYFVVSLLQLETTNTSIPVALLSEMAEKSITDNEIETILSGGKKIVHLVISSSNYESIFGIGLFNNDLCYSMGYAQSESNIVLTSEVEKGTSPFTDIINVYKTIEKPLNLYATVVKSDFSIHTLEKKSKNNVRGFPLINVLTTLKSPYLDTIHKKLDDRKREVGELKEKATIQEKLEYERKFIKWKKEYDTLILDGEEGDSKAIANNNKDDYFHKVTGEIELREVYITNETLRNGLQTQYAKFHFDKDENFDFLVSIVYTFHGYGKLDTKKHFYDGEINPNEVIYGMIDAASLFFAPVGLDTVFDFVGLAFASYNRDSGRMLEYSVGLVMFSYAQYGSKFINKYKLIRVKKEGGISETIIKNIEDELKEGEELITEIIGKNIEDAGSRVKTEGLVADIIEGVGQISAGNHMLVLGGDLGKTTKRLSAIETKTTDNVIDIVVHGADNKIIIDGKEVTDITNIKKWLAEKHPNADKVRLLSCTSLEGAQDFANKLGDKFTVQATDGYVRVHNDGLVSVVPRQQGGGTEWYELGANRRKKVLSENARPRGPDADRLADANYVDDFLELSTRSVDDINNAGGELLKRFDDLDLSSLTTKLDDLTSAQKTKFLDEFADASDDALKQLNNNGAELLDTWGSVSHLTQFTNNVDFLQWLSKAKQSHLPIHLVGEVNSSGRAVGCHLLEALDGVKVKISNEALTIKNSAGDIVRAKIEILDPSTAGFVEKGALSTFFPKSWDKSRALEEVAGVLVNPSNQVNPRKFVGLSSDGVTRIEVRLTGPNGNLVFDTAFPLN
ncbi:EndoU domain-containing protein [Aquimarina agarilytica]|uniref:EndoU domain-containing protein n=1 Tax=Aquimarina agarilytica TaxID=1087449 RepID=UPI0002890305|nr:EndoU domain-containing protein [Aquimarina agarilytica]